MRAILFTAILGLSGQPDTQQNDQEGRTALGITIEREAARERFVELYGINSNYRDVVARLEELKE